MKPKGQIQPQSDLPSTIPITRNETTAVHGKRTSKSSNCRAVKASPTMLISNPQVQSMGSRRGNAWLKIVPLRKRNDKN
jgi:hypothetical protein